MFDFLKSKGNNLNKTFKTADNADNAEKLIYIAQDGARLLVSNYRNLATNGGMEVLLFNTNFVLNSKCLINSNQRVDIEDIYFLILIEVLKAKRPTYSDERLRLFINRRLRFYNEEYNKLINNRTYTAMFLFSNFYINPLHEDSDPIGTTYTLELFTFTPALYSMINWIQKQIE